MKVTLETYILDRKHCSLEKFRQRHPHPVLLYRHTKEDGSSAASGFQTQFLDLTAKGDAAGENASSDPMATQQFSARPPIMGASVLGSIGGASAAELEIFPLQKRPGSPFAERLSIGRTRASDVSLPFSTVSKFHGYFLWQGELDSDAVDVSVVDMGATNGTQIDGQPLVHKEAMTLRDGSELVIGGCLFHFYVVGSFYRLLGKLPGVGG